VNIAALTLRNALRCYSEMRHSLLKSVFIAMVTVTGILSVTRSGSAGFDA
jgi:hypothetical protein